MIRVANAPVSYGVFELTAGGVDDLPSAERLLDAVAQAGYGGIDLGPPGYLGDVGALPDRLASRGLGLAGGFVAMRFLEPDGFRDDLAALDEALDLFTVAAGLEADRSWYPKPTLADAGSPERDANPGRGRDLDEIRLDDAGWRRVAGRVTEAAGRCRARGLEPTFHHHLCTYVEAPREIEQLLDRTDVGLCLDTAHLLLGGGDPVQAMRDWGDRVNHVHVKDARPDVMRDVVADQAGMEAVWRRGAFCELGAGSVDVDGFLSAMRRDGYAGWLVVEQDRILSPGESLSAPVSAQRRNRAFLRERGL
ncbi:TIM barrel protein [soil metagenome]